METLKNLKKGEYFKFREESDIVYVKGDYDRSTKKFDCYKFDDVNSFRQFAADKFVFIDFEF